MPKHPVVNRVRPAGDGTPEGSAPRYDRPRIQPKVLYATETSIAAAADRAEKMHVSMGSVVDTALQLLERMTDEELIAAMTAAGHLIGDEPDKVRQVLAAAAPAPAQRPRTRRTSQ